MGWKDIHAAQQRAQQTQLLREMAAQQAGQAPPKPKGLDKWVLGAEGTPQPKKPASSTPQPTVAELAATVAAQQQHIEALQEQVNWAIARIQELQQPAKD